MINGKCTGGQQTSIRPSVPVELLPGSRPEVTVNNRPVSPEPPPGFLTDHGEAFVKEKGDKFGGGSVKSKKAGRGFLPLVVGGIAVERPGDMPWMASLRPFTFYSSNGKQYPKHFCNINNLNDRRRPWEKHFETILIGFVEGH